jgi:hypothetical protein
MRNIVLVLGCMVAIMTLHSCEEEIYGCTNVSAINYDQDANIDDGACEYNNISILGTWEILTVEQSYEVNELMVDEYKGYLELMGYEDFVEIYGNLPISYSDWVNLVVIQTTTIDTLSSSFYNFTETQITIPGLGSNAMNYEFIDQSEIELTNNDDILGFTKFDLALLTESDLILASKKYISVYDTNQKLSIHLKR